MKFFSTIYFWLKAARLHTLPMSFMSWLVVFCWCAKLGGNISLGILALIGVMLAHLGVNLIDDYFETSLLISREGANALETFPAFNSLVILKFAVCLIFNDEAPTFSV